MQVPPLHVHDAPDAHVTEHDAQVMSQRAPFRHETCARSLAFSVQFAPRSQVSLASCPAVSTQRTPSVQLKVARSPAVTVQVDEF